MNAASDPILAMERMKATWPDVVVLDVEMPRMDGLTFLRKIMSERPTPVVICSTLTEKGAKTTIEALSAGAVATIAKPRLDLKNFLNASARELISVIKDAAGANVSRLARHGAAVSVAPRDKNTADVILPPAVESAPWPRPPSR